MAGLFVAHDGPALTRAQRREFKSRAGPPISRTSHVGPMSTRHIR